MKEEESYDLRQYYLDKAKYHQGGGDAGTAWLIIAVGVIYVIAVFVFL
jgi:hypothetical protein